MGVKERTDDDAATAPLLRRTRRRRRSLLKVGERDAPRRSRGTVEEGGELEDEAESWVIGGRLRAQAEQGTEAEMEAGLQEGQYGGRGTR
ncbi:hypothetical protein NL676_005966 [Syzygium grande]|nr:hypothetical protein NL676_005966 [Syzygium grande]